MAASSDISLLLHLVMNANKKLRKAMGSDGSSVVFALFNRMSWQFSKSILRHCRHNVGRGRSGEIMLEVEDVGLSGIDWLEHLR